MLEANALDGRTVVGTLPPQGGIATVENIAINAVMAGCRLEYLPVVIAAVEAVADSRFGLIGPISSTSSLAVLTVVNGPVRRALGINSGPAVFGPGSRANATIGRAVSLVVRNVGGAIPGVLDRSQLGQPGKFTYCIAENEESSPWEPLHVERGFDAAASTVTVVGAESLQQIENHWSATAEEVLTCIADSVAALGNFNFWGQLGGVIVLGVEHARIIAEDGWSKQNVKEFLCERARRPASLLRRVNKIRRMHTIPDGAMEKEDAETTLIPIARTPDEFVVVVAGGEAGGYSAFVEAYNGEDSVPITKPIRFRHESLTSDTGST
jgi:hypothetical protein